MNGDAGSDGPEGRARGAQDAGSDGLKGQARGAQDAGSDGPEGRARGAKDDHAGVVIRPPLLWFLTAGIGIGLDQWIPLPFMPTDWPNIWIGAGIFAIGFSLAIWAFRQFENFREDVDTHSPSTYITATGPFAFSRNPIYLGMLLGLLGVAAGFDTLWVVVALAVWYPVIHWGVIAREETYLEGKFGDAYGNYKSRVRRWL